MICVFRTFAFLSYLIIFSMWYVWPILMLGTLVCLHMLKKIPTNEFPIIFGSRLCKVENIWKGNLDSIPSPSPSMLIQIMSGKICLRSIGKTLLSTNFWKQKVCWHHPACFALLPQVNFPANNLNFHWRWWDQIYAIL